MIINIEGDKSSIENALNILDELPEEFRPLYFTDTEGVLDKKNDLCADIERFNEFKKDNPLGFMLYATSCEMDVSFSDVGYSSIFIEVKRKTAYKKASEVLTVLAKSQPVFGYAGMWEEMKCRNGTFKDFGDYTLEWWVGRDVDRYVPGLYWLTLLSKEKLVELNVNMDSLLRITDDVKSLEDDSYVLMQLYGKAKDWDVNKENIDNFCFDTEGFFSRRRIQDELDSIKERDEYDAFMAEWP